MLICQGCCYAFEPFARERVVEDRLCMADGCPECGDWLYLVELVHPGPMPGPRRART